MRTRHHRFAAAAALTATAALVLAGCGAEEPTQDPMPSTETTTAGSSPAVMAERLSPEETETSAPSASPADPEPKSERSTDAPQHAQLVVSEIRVGEYQGRDRVVFELDGQGTPGYSVNYVDAPVQQGSGHPVELDGDSFLQVTLMNQVLPTETDMTEVPVGTVSADEVSGVAGVAFTGQFEGQSRSVIGLEGTDRDFTAFQLQNPTRLVVDIER